MKTKKIPFLGVFLALALIFSYVESLIPFFFGVPGMKLGLANALIVLLLCRTKAREALLVNIARILLAGFLFGNAFSILYSLAGGLLSFAVMLLLKRTEKLSVISISVAGGIAHNFGQILIACLVMESWYLLYYFPVLLLAGFVTGFLMGLLAREILKRIPEDIFGSVSSDKRA